MREIKFRAWEKKENKMIFWKDFWKETDGCFLEGIEIDIMQFTGLLDKVGKEIYEGDIVADKNESVFHYLERSDSKPSDGIWYQKHEGSNIQTAFTEKVIFARKCEIIEWQEKETGFFPFADSPDNCGHCGGGESPDRFEVIGNIYENPELISK